MALPIIAQVAIQFGIGLAFSLISELTREKEKKDPPTEVKQLKAPDAKVGKTIIAVYGETEITEGNTLYIGDESIRYVRRPSEGKKA